MNFNQPQSGVGIVLTLDDLNHLGNFFDHIGILLLAIGVIVIMVVVVVCASIYDEAKDRDNLLRSFIQLTDNEGKQGDWRVSLDYDNVQDVARVLDADGNVIGECGDVNLSADEQFVVAIRMAVKKREGDAP